MCKRHTFSSHLLYISKCYLFYNQNDLTLPFFIITKQNQLHYNFSIKVTASCSLPRTLTVFSGVVLTLEKVPGAGFNSACVGHSCKEDEEMRLCYFFNLGSIDNLIDM